MLTINDEIISTILDLAEDYALARLTYVATPPGIEHIKARGYKLAKFMELQEYLSQIQKAQQQGQNEAPSAHEPYPNERRRDKLLHKNDKRQM